ncbi:MAG: tRNA epoxyqueuosine(34) reductase QueG [Planctomycetota bacterium]
MVKAAARELGFSLVGVCQASLAPGFDFLAEWLKAGFAGEMSYLGNRYEAYAHPRNVLEGVRSVVMLGWEYRVDDPVRPEPGQGRVSRYAWSDTDYHELIRQRLNQLAAQLSTMAPGCRVRGVVDTAPLLEREFAQLAGLGWVGKNTLLIHREIGSWFFLAALLTDLPLNPDNAWDSDHCGSCRACLDACPTQAFPAPYVLDAARCVSYLTIELRAPVPVALREGLGDWLFGCDICQEVCPWNRHAARRRPGTGTEPPRETDSSQRSAVTVAEPMDASAAVNVANATAKTAMGRPFNTPWETFHSRTDANPIDVIALLGIDEAEFRARFRDTPLWRAKRRGLLRNAAYILGNHPVQRALDALFHGLNDPEPLVRGACAWAIGRYHGPNRPPWQSDGACAVVSARLAARLELEWDPAVRGELLSALGVSDANGIGVTN